LSDQSQSSNMNAPVRISRLAEALEKEYDYSTAIQTLKAMFALGYRIKKAK
jgi:hypothetical protein